MFPSQGHFRVDQKQKKVCQDIEQNRTASIANDKSREMKPETYVIFVKLIIKERSKTINIYLTYSEKKNY